MKHDRCAKVQRLTAWELQRAGIAVSVLPDGAAASLLASGAIGSRDCRR